MQQQVERIIEPSLVKLNSTISSVQQSTARVEQLEKQTRKIQQQQEDFSTHMSKSLQDITGMMQENLRVMRSETQSLQSTQNTQFQQLMSMLQPKLSDATVPR